MSIGLTHNSASTSLAEPTGAWVQADPQCPWCGGGTDNQGNAHEPSTTDAAEALRMLAELWLENEKLVRFVFVRVLFPRWSLRQCEHLVGYDHTFLCKLTRKIKRQAPELAAFLQARGTATVGQQRRRRREKLNGKDVR